MKKGLIIGAILVVGSLIGVGSMLEKIPTGYVGVIYSPNGGVKEKTLSQGWHFVNPLYKVTEYTVATEQAYMSKDKREGSEEDDSFNVPTSDGKLVNVDIEYSYRFDAEKLPETFTKFRGRTGEEIQNQFLRGKLKTWVAEVTSQFNVLDIYGSKRTLLNNEVYKHVKEECDKYGIIIESINISRIGLDSATERAIQSRVNAQQELERQKIEKEKAKIEMEKRAIIEEGNKKVILIKASAEAEKILLEANARAEANEKLSKSLTPELVEYKKIEKWNGQVPQIQGNATPIINMTK